MFISSAYAEAAAPAQGMGVMDVMVMAVLAVIFYFFIILPPSKRAKEQKNMVEALQRGDEIVTAGGEVGRVSKIYEQYAGVELAENIEVIVQKSSIQLVLPKGTIKSIK